MKALIGILMILCGITLGLYVGIWVCFIGGIVDVIASIRAEELIAMDVAIGVAKFIFAGVAGWFSACLLVIPGMAFLASGGLYGGK